MLHFIILILCVPNTFAQKGYIGIWKIEANCKLIKKIEAHCDTFEIAELNKLQLPKSNYAVFKSGQEINVDSINIFLNALDINFDEAQNAYRILIDIDSMRSLMSNLRFLNNGTLFLFNNRENKIEITDELPIVNHKLNGLCKSYLSFDTIQYRIFANFNNNLFDGTTTYFYNSRISSVYLYEQNRLIYKIIFDENCFKISEFFNGQFYNYDKKGNIINNR